MSGFLGQIGPLPGFVVVAVVVFVVVFSLTKIDIDLCHDFLGKSDPYLEFLCCCVFWLNKN